MICYRWSNINEAGVFVFKLTTASPLENVMEPTVQSESSKSFTKRTINCDCQYFVTGFDPTLARSCNEGGSSCHSSASCKDYPTGFCCQCNPTHYGNGQTCLPNGVPQRVSGLISGTINSVSFQNQDLHSYVVTEDGRTYTAVSRLNDDIGEDMQSLFVIGTPIAWLFAQPLQEAQNGFGLTGGSFNYTGIVDFPDTRHSVEIKLNFLASAPFMLK